LLLSFCQFLLAAYRVLFGFFVVHIPILQQGKG
jgi:hypothetical protein